MGHKFSVVHGVKSDKFYEQGNAINEIWVGDVEIISRLPFGDSDISQAGWSPGKWPKIPWHHFIIPLKRDLKTVYADSEYQSNSTTVRSFKDYKDRFMLIHLGILLVFLVFGVLRLILKHKRARLTHLRDLDEENSPSSCV
ncbi:uncharacterized protein N7482_008222 [Penicillium canariense]|uniref:Uncharacterized protein n=1 Tax=Penicillium canariense TaxID=189055 RepID=A0A9W9LIJ8_9EURO|nr:uncharacterized protein N7482_008222 [Penicillium canariense]KAJ5157122.1 hypothetical protein N7482_008222 [Penicillium canariense]